MSYRPRVALIIETSNEYARGILHGIRTYILKHDSWSIDMGELSRGEPALEWLKDWKGDGIIARIETQRIAQTVVKANLPTVDVSAARLLPELPMVETDDEKISHLAAKYLMQFGLKQFAYCGDPSFQWSQWRSQYFSKYLDEHGHQCQLFPGNKKNLQPHTWAEQLRAIEQWLKEMDKPVGVMACYDYRGRQVLEACRRGGMRVPEDVSVISVDNDEMLCDLSDPPMTSIARPNCLIA